MSYYELASLFHTAVFILLESFMSCLNCLNIFTFIFFNFASAVSSMSLLLGDIMMGLVTFGGDMTSAFVLGSAHLELYC